MRMGCAECQCVVDHGVRVEWCKDPMCCCAHLPKEGERVTQPR